MVTNILLVGAGGFLGSIARYLVSILLVPAPATSSFPLSTLLVNVSGCFALGTLAGYIERSNTVPTNLVLFLAVGVLGGFTTFSAFGLETITLIRNHQIDFAIMNVSLSLILGLGAVWIGRSIS